MHRRFLVWSVVLCLALTKVGVVHAAAVSGDAAKQMALTLAKGVEYRNAQIESISAECVYAQWLSEVEQLRWVPGAGPDGRPAPSVGVARPPAEQACWLRLDYETGRLC
ncbi:MAG: hypothetical protein KAI66_27870, partial [Lentisphaeria bacterium]|nr:hypothetical protein [Lentisphaeria bacterium]